MRIRNPANSQSGQAVTEYILLIAVIGGFSSASFGRPQASVNLLASFPERAHQGNFAHAYQYGHPKPPWRYGRRRRGPS